MEIDFEELAAKHFGFPQKEIIPKKMSKKKYPPLRDKCGRFVSREKQKKEEMTVSKIRDGELNAFDKNVGYSSDSSVCKLGKSCVNFVTMTAFCAGGLLYIPYFNSVEEGAELLKQIEKQASRPGRKYGVLLAFINNIPGHCKAFELAGFERREFLSPRYQNSYRKGNPMVMYWKIINQ